MEEEESLPPPLPATEHGSEEKKTAKGRPAKKGKEVEWTSCLLTMNEDGNMLVARNPADSDPTFTTYPFVNVLARDQPIGGVNGGEEHVRAAMARVCREDLGLEIEARSFFRFGPEREQGSGGSLQSYYGVAICSQLASSMKVRGW